MKKRISFMALGCIVAGSLMLSACSSGNTFSSVPDVIQVKNVADEPKISLSASETVEVVPDMAEVVYGITTENEDAEKCQQENTEKLNQLLEYLKAQGFEDKSIRTSGFSLDPRYDWSGNRQELIGYEMRTQVTVTDIPMDQVGAMLTKGVESGANEIYSVSYFSSQYDEAYAEALTKAMESARGKAEALTAASGKKLGDVIAIEEYNNGQYGRYISAEMGNIRKMAAAESATGSMDMGVMPGEMQVTANISVEFALVSAE